MALIDTKMYAERKLLAILNLGALLSLFTYALSILITEFTCEKSFYSLCQEKK